MKVFIPLLILKVQDTVDRIGWINFCPSKTSNSSGFVLCDGSVLDDAVAIVVVVVIIVIIQIHHGPNKDIQNIILLVVGSQIGKVLSIG